MSDDFVPIEDVEENNQLVKLVEESGIEKSKGQVLLEKFSNFFQLAGEWEIKAKSIVITRLDQKAEMKMAKQGRLFLKSKRVEIENTRKSLKEQALREGKAIDGIANVLKALIEPLEEHLDRQEKFAERLEQERKNTLRAERLALLFPLNVDPNMYSDLGEMDQQTWDNVHETAKLNFQRIKDAEKKAEADRIAKEAEEAKERERIRLENEKLKAEAVEHERLAKIEKDKADKLLAEERAKADKILAEAKAKADAEAKALAEKNRIEREKQEAVARKAKAEAEDKLRRERAENDRLQAELKAKQDKEAKELKAKQDAEKKAKSAPDKEKLKVLADHLRNPKLPEMTCEESQQILAVVKEKMRIIADFIYDQITNK